MIRKITDSTKTLLWISILVLIIVASAEMTFGLIRRNSNNQIEMFQEDIKNNTRKIELIETIAIENSKANAVIINRLENIDKELIEIKEILKENK